MATDLDLETDSETETEPSDGLDRRSQVIALFGQLAKIHADPSSYSGVRDVRRPILASLYSLGYQAEPEKRTSRLMGGNAGPAPGTLVEAFSVLYDAVEAGDLARAHEAMTVFSVAGWSVTPTHYRLRALKKGLGTYGPY